MKLVLTDHETRSLFIYTGHFNTLLYLDLDLTPEEAADRRTYIHSDIVVSDDIATIKPTSGTTVSQIAAFVERAVAHVQVRAGTIG